jgi:hypothetical protein
VNAAGWPRRALLASALATVAILTACSSRPHADCEPAGPGLTAQVQRVTSSSVTTLYATPSRIADNAWLVSARTPHGVAVWATTSEPGTTGTSGLVFAVNDAARADAIVEVDQSGGSAPVAADIESDTEGIRVAESCV